MQASGGARDRFLLFLATFIANFAAHIAAEMSPLLEFISPAFKTRCVPRNFEGAPALQEIRQHTCITS